MSSKKIICDLGSKTINLANYKTKSLPPAAKRVVMEAGCKSTPPPSPGANKASDSSRVCNPQAGSSNVPCNVPCSQVPCSPSPSPSPCRPVFQPVCPTNATPKSPCPTPAKPLRVCSPQDMRRLCAPQPCDCLPLPPPLTFFQRLTHFVGLTIKAGAVLAIVAYTDAQGLWAGQGEAERLYGRMVRSAAGVLGADLHVPKGGLPPVPVVHDYVYWLGTMYNHGVQFIFNGVLFLPGVLMDTLDSVKDPDESEPPSQDRMKTGKQS